MQDSWLGGEVDDVQAGMARGRERGGATVPRDHRHDEEGRGDQEGARRGREVIGGGEEE